MHVTTLHAVEEAVRALDPEDLHEMGYRMALSHKALYGVGPPPSSAGAATSRMGTSVIGSMPSTPSTWPSSSLRWPGSRSTWVTTSNPEPAQAAARMMALPRTSSPS